MSEEARYQRHIGLFGAEGQQRIASARVVIVGLGGTGSHVAQQLAYLGVCDYHLIDGDEVSLSNLNRLIGAVSADVGTPKVAIAARNIRAIQPTATVIADDSMFSDVNLHNHADRDVIFACVDDDVVRLDLVRHASARALAYVDLATDVAPTGEFGGRVVFAKDGERCLSCLGELDQHALARATMTDDQRDADDKIYGIEREALATTGPSVVSVNGVIASLAVTEFMVWRTRLREPVGYLNYRGDRGTVASRTDPARDHCHYCMTAWGAERAP